MMRDEAATSAQVPGLVCAHCGTSPPNGRASVQGKTVCHVYESGVPERDCYRLVTVYGESLGSRRGEAVEVGEFVARMRRKYGE